MKDPFEAAIEEKEEWPPESPGGGGGDGRVEGEQTPEEEEEEDERALKRCQTSEEKDNMGAEFTRYPTPAKMQTILTQFTEDQMSRYESFRRSALHKSNMKKLLQSITGQKVSDTLNIVVCGIAKMFVGELVEKLELKWVRGKIQDQSDLAISESPIEDLSSKAKCLRDQFRGFSAS